MRIAPVLVTCALAALPVAGCSTDEPAPLPPEPLSVGEGDFTIAVTGDARTIRLLRHGVALLTFDNHGFQLGTVPELLPNRSYDPWWYEPEEGNAKIPPPEGFAWRDVTAARITGRDRRMAVVELDFDGGAGGRLTITPGAQGRFALSLRPTHVPTGQQVAMVRLRPRASTTEGLLRPGANGATT